MLQPIAVRLDNLLWLLLLWLRQEGAQSLAEKTLHPDGFRPAAWPTPFVGSPDADSLSLDVLVHAFPAAPGF